MRVSQCSSGASPRKFLRLKVGFDEDIVDELFDLARVACETNHPPGQRLLVPADDACVGVAVASEGGADVGVVCVGGGRFILCGPDRFCLHQKREPHRRGTRVFRCSKQASKLVRCGAHGLLRSPMKWSTL